MTEEEIRQRVKEERILAYAYYAAGEQTVRMKVGPDTETGE